MKLFHVFIIFATNAIFGKIFAQESYIITSTKDGTFENSGEFYQSPKKIKDKLAKLEKYHQIEYNLFKKMHKAKIEILEFFELGKIDESKKSELFDKVNNLYLHGKKKTEQNFHAFKQSEENQNNKQNAQSSVELIHQFPKLTLIKEEFLRSHKEKMSNYFNVENSEKQKIPLFSTLNKKINLFEKEEKNKNKKTDITQKETNENLNIPKNQLDALYYSKKKLERKIFGIESPVNSEKSKNNLQNRQNKSNKTNFKQRRIQSQKKFYRRGESGYQNPYKNKNSLLYRKKTNLF